MLCNSLVAASRRPPGGNAPTASPLGHAQARAALGQAGAPPEPARYGDVFKQVMLLSGSSLKSVNIHNKHKAGISCSKNVVPSSLATSTYAAGIWGF